MNPNRSIFKKFFIFGILLFCWTVRAQQSCNCPLLSDQQEDWTEVKDSATVFKQIARLEKSANSGCRFESLDIRYNFLIKNNEPEKALSILKQQQNFRIENDCKDFRDYAINANYAYYYHVTNDLEKLSLYAFKALRGAEKLDDLNKRIKALEQIVYLLTKMNEHAKNWPYILQAQQLIAQQPSGKPSARNYRWLAFQYEQKYTLTQRKTLLDSALIFANRSRKIAFGYHMYDEITNLYRVKESCAYHKGAIKDALVYIDSAIYFAKKIEGFKNLAPLYSAKAWDHLDSGQPQEADRWMDTALSMARGLKDSSGKMMMYFDASNLYKEAGKTDKAFEAFKLYTQMKDSVWNLEKVEKVNELEQRYNKIKNEKTIFELEKAQQRYMFLIVVGLLAILTLVFFFRQRTLSNRQKIMQTEQRLNRARINPHFFFNAMASLQQVSLSEQSPKTTLFLARFAKIMRQSLESTYQELVSLEDEIDFMTDYLQLQQLRFPEKFEYHFQVAGTLEVNELKIPGMLLQPFVENAIEHGFKNIDYKGIITIVFEDLQDRLKVCVKDNGTGQTLSAEKTHPSRAMQIVKDRIYLFNKQHHCKAFYEVNSEPGAGFAVALTLPKIY